MDRKYKIGDYVLTEDDSVVRIHSYTEDEYYVTNLSGNILPTEYAEKSLHTNIFKEGDYVQIERCTGVPISASSYMHALVGQFGIVVSTKYDTIVVDSIIDGETHRWKWNSHDLRKVDRYLKIGDLVTMVSNDADVQYKISGYSSFGYKISHLDGGEKPGIFKIDSLKKIPKFKIGDTVTVVGLSGFLSSYTNDMKKTIGLNGIVIDNECGYTVQFARPTGNGNYSWVYNENDLKLVEGLLDIEECRKIPNMFNAHKYSSRLASENFLESKRFEFKIGDRVVHNGDRSPKFCHRDSTHAFIHTRKIDEGEEVYTLKYPDGYIGTYNFPKKSLSKTGQKFNIGDKVIILDSNRPDYGEARTIYKLVDGGYLLEISATKSGSMTWIKYGTTTWEDDELDLIPEEPKFKLGQLVKIGNDDSKIGIVCNVKNNLIYSVSNPDYLLDNKVHCMKKYHEKELIGVSSTLKNPWDKEIKISMNDNYIHGSVIVKDEEVYRFTAESCSIHTPKTVFENCMLYPTKSDPPKPIRFSKFKFIEVEGVDEYEKNHCWADSAHGRLFDYDYGIIQDLPGIGLSLKREWFEEV